MKTRLLKSFNWIYIYYFFLLLILVSRTSDLAPNSFVRLAYLTAFFVPILLKYRNLYLPCLICFMTIGTYGFAYSYFPYMMYLYAIISLIGLIFTSKSALKVTISKMYTFLILYVLIVDLVTSGHPSNIFYSSITIALGAMIADKRARQSKELLLNTFSIISIVLSLLYLLNYDKFLTSYNPADDMERSGWTDPNYLSCIIGMGVVSSLILLLRNNTKNAVLTIARISIIAISLICQLLLASRGGLLAVSLSILIILFLSKIKFKYKFLLSLLIILFIVWLYTNSYLDLLIYRISNDVDGSGRLQIWSKKLSAFYNDAGPVYWLFGYGYDGAYKLASMGDGFGFHNDYLAFLCGYGIIGLSLFCYAIFIYPLTKVSKQSSATVVALVSFLMLSCLTLEPISAGRLTYYAFAYLILLVNKEA